MRLLRLFFTALITVVTVVAGLFAAAAVIFAGLVAFVVQLFREKKARSSEPDRPPTPGHYRSKPSDDVIDVEARRVSADPIEQ